MVWAHTTNLTPPLFIEVHVPNQEGKRSCVCLLGVSIVPVFTIFLLDLGAIWTEWYYLLFSFCYIGI